VSSSPPSLASSSQRTKLGGWWAGVVLTAPLAPLLGEQHSMIGLDAGRLAEREHMAGHRRCFVACACLCSFAFTLAVQVVVLGSIHIESQHYAHLRRIMLGDWSTHARPDCFCTLRLLPRTTKIHCLVTIAAIGTCSMRNQVDKGGPAMPPPHTPLRCFGGERGGYRAGGRRSGDAVRRLVQPEHLLCNRARPFHHGGIR
jgi:hypothetical protein